MDDEADRVSGDAPTLSEDPVLILLGKESGDHEVFVAGALQGGRAIITGGLPFPTQTMRIRTLADPVR